jgi:hypothetical protein
MSLKEFKEYLYQMKHPERAVPVIYKDKEVLVSAPGSFEACHKYGVGAWCTTGNPDFYDKYTRGGECPLLWVSFAKDQDIGDRVGKPFYWQVSTSPYADGEYVHSFEVQDSDGKGWSLGLRIQDVLNQMSEQARVVVADFLDSKGAEIAAEGFRSGELDADYYDSNSEYKEREAKKKQSEFTFSSRILRSRRSK